MDDIHIVLSCHDGSTWLHRIRGSQAIHGRQSYRPMLAVLITSEGCTCLTWTTFVSSKLLRRQHAAAPHPRGAYPHIAIRSVALGCYDDSTWLYHQGCRSHMDSNYIVLYVSASHSHDKGEQVWIMHYTGAQVYASYGNV